FPAKPCCSGEGWNGGAVQLAPGANQCAGCHGVAIGQDDAPPSRSLVPGGADDFAVVSDMRLQTIPCHYVFDICQDFRLSGENTGPGRVLRERIGIQVRGNVASGAGVVIVTPGSARAAVLLE